ncbi:AAA-type ATPase core domain containing protein [Cryptosporidium parvum]|uniref:Uncharacterized protein n=1 Tax=Cryptosporidium parvum TaxID=5807 RepID=A0A7S7RH49_CRYPV|nr:AAA-type ATPase core domain containing protein [Cryptosporidium parvum]WKS76973.1 hypothetical protein CPCDC_3g2285 [Cryptosporidium sp. 43IA8]WRK31464.1 AAA-type ATPase core domain containing protein [Cryptosporidium parvum]|eukprot:QOY42579.1 hypothetical protein CPATCC_001227 [Cryptosporidium parvum]
MRDNCMHYKRNILKGLISSIKSLCEAETNPNNISGINALKIYVLKLSLRNAIATYEIERISSLLKIMDKKIRIIKSIKGLTYQLKNFLQYIINDKNAIQNTENQDLISLYNWLNESKLFS